VSRKTFVRIEIAFLLAMLAWAPVLNCAGFPDPFSTVFLLAYFYLVVGWALFLARVVPNVLIDWFSVSLAVACLLGLICVMHFFCVWLHKEISMRKAAFARESGQERPPIPAWRLPTTLGILGIVVLMFVAGTAAVGSIHQLVWLRTRQ
jgi:hypothetical protein